MSVSVGYRGQYLHCLRLRRSDVWWLTQLVSEGLEKLLNIVMVTHDSSRDQVKAALRDLGMEHGGMGVSKFEEKK